MSQKCIPVSLTVLEIQRQKWTGGYFYPPVAGIRVKDGVVTKYENISFANSKWRAAAIFKIVFWLYLRDLLSNFRKILCEEAESSSDTGHVTKIPNFYNSRWRTQIFIPRTVTCWFIKKYEIQNGGQPPYWKSYFGYISSSVYWYMAAKGWITIHVHTYSKQSHNKIRVNVIGSWRGHSI